MRLRTKLAWIGVLYLAEGFPFGIAYDVWPVYFRVHGVSLREIGLMALLFLPYTLKPAWAPLVDRWGSRQSWVAACELGLAAGCLAMVFIEPTRTDWALWVALLSFTFFSATQDISIDAYAVDIATPKDSGLINGMRVSTARIAFLVGGGGLLLLADQAFSGWRGVWLVSAGLCVAFSLLALASPRVSREPPKGLRISAGFERGPLLRYRLLFGVLTIVLLFVAHAADWNIVWLTLAVLAGTLTIVSFFDTEVLGWLLQRPMLPVLAFVLLYKVGDSTLGRMVKPYWVDTGMTNTEIGVVSVWVGAGLTFAGAMLGGWYITKKGIFQALLWMGLAQLISNFGYVAVAALDLPHGNASFFNLSIGPHQAALYSASIVESVTQGLGTAAFGAFLMNLCDKSHAATQYAMLSAAFALSRDFLGAFSGLGVEQLGYAWYFTVTACLAIPALLLLPAIRGKIREEEEPEDTDAGEGGEAAGSSPPPAAR